MNVLLVEDDAELARQLLTELTENGSDVQVESNGRSGLNAALEDRWDLAILDVSLPDLSGFEIVGQMRAKGILAPVIFLTARGEVKDRVQGLSLGADDYLTKPFSMDELKARLQALTRRHGNARPPSPVLPDGWKLDPLLRSVIIKGLPIELQPREWSLLELFLKHESEILTNSFLLDRVWNIRFDPGTNVVNSTICRLRKKLDVPEGPSHIETIRGRGHVFRSHV